jgi:hypothetical protein
VTKWGCSCGRSDCRLCSYSDTVGLFMWPVWLQAVPLKFCSSSQHFQDTRSLTAVQSVTAYCLHFTAPFICHTIRNDCYCTRLYTSSYWQTVNNKLKGICKEQCGLCRVLCWNRLGLRKAGQSVPKHKSSGLSVTEGYFLFVAENWKLATRSKKEIISFDLLECDEV